MFVIVEMVLARSGRPLPDGVDRDRGANLVEYLFLVSLIAIICLLAVTFFGDSTSVRFSRNASSIP